MIQTQTSSTGRGRCGRVDSCFILLTLVFSCLGGGAQPARAQDDMTPRGAMVNQKGSASDNCRPVVAPGDILYTDSGDAVLGGAVIKLDPRTGQSQLISTGGLLRLPSAVVIDTAGSIVVADSGRIIRIDPVTKLQTLVADSSTWPLLYPYGLDLNPQGDLFVADLRSLVRMDHRTGTAQIVSAGGNFAVVLAVACGDGKQAFVLNRGLSPQIIAVNSGSGGQRVVTETNLLIAPRSLTCRGNKIYVTDVATADGNFGIGRILQVNLRTGQTRIVSEGNLLVGPVGITMEDEEHILVADPYTINPTSHDLYDGAIVRIHIATGRQGLVARGSNSFVNPLGITVMRHPGTHANPHGSSRFQAP